MLLILLTSVDPNCQKIPLQDLALLMDNLDMQVHNEKAVWDNVAYDMWGKVLIWVLLLPYYLKGLCDVGVLRSLAICHLQFLVFAVLSRHVPALNVFPCDVPRLLKQTILGPQIPKRWKRIMTCDFYVHILFDLFKFKTDVSITFIIFLHFSEIYENQLTCLSSTN